MAALTRTLRARLLSPGLVLLLALLAGCAVPLGPGFRVTRESVTVRYQPPTPDFHYTVRAVVKNTGNQPLDAVRIQVAMRQQGGVAAASTAGPQSTAVSEAAEGKRLSFALPFQPALRRKETRRQAPFGYVVPVHGQAILLEPRDWFPVFLAPKGLFGEAEPRARKTELDIFVPSGYGVLTTGRPLGVRRDLRGGMSEYRFETRHTDFLPFLLIARYAEQTIGGGKARVTFWTRRTLPGACAEAFAAHLGETSRFYRSTFTVARRGNRPIPFIERPAGNASPISDEAGGFGSVPGGVVFSVPASELCVQPSRYFFSADRALAATWFGWAVEPEPGSGPILAAGAQRYAALAAEERAGGTAARERQVARWLAEYEHYATLAAPVAPARLTLHSTPLQRRMAGIQSALSLIALEDRFGAKPVERALAHLVRSLRGKSAGLNELRSALEEETGSNLYDFFNRWLGRPGIPAAFRGRYSQKAAAGRTDRTNSKSRRIP
jgi:hypothetical protein